ncbi:hypothetical protein SEA_LUCKYBARNES_65 [Brevibacterium phage LuckyBarnes]|uniref:C2H2-type domain-containing protein n=1 Tax=Brevibacterium phage LuckyBarnes TaxID=2027888 RepID=A0A249XNS9_9CAUD|nr:hypothetical protein HOS02_gp65 [Brevibacterium phage LuckyBarnes]ASZ73382.1 hypothetical protein SEA_LUCKYBARNES_65 [Brevibacterium phage LuckyBarnes]
MRGEQCAECGYVGTDSMYRHQMMTGHRGSTPGTITRVNWMGKWQFVPDEAPVKVSSGRFRCAECDTTSTAAGIGSHQKSSGHAGRVPA